LRKIYRVFRVFRLIAGLTRQLVIQAIIRATLGPRDDMVDVEVTPQRRPAIGASATLRRHQSINNGLPLLDLASLFVGATLIAVSFSPRLLK